MTVMLALLLAQATPADAIKQLTEAVEKKDMAKLSALFGEEVSAEDLEQTDKSCEGHFVAALKKCPALDAAGADVSELSVEYSILLGQKELVVGLALRKTGDKWQIKDVDANMMSERRSQGEAGKCKATVADVQKGFIAALEKKDWKKLLEFAPEKVRAKENPEKIGKMFEEIDARLKGQFVPAVKKVPTAAEPDDSVVYLSLEIRSAKMRAQVEYYKEKGCWVVKDFEVDERKEEKDDE